MTEDFTPGIETFVCELRDIFGISPLNPRHGEETDVASLAATIRAKGLLHPLLVRDTTPHADTAAFEVLAGSRRWRALKQLDAEAAAAGESGDGLRVPILVFTGTDDEAREAILAIEATVVPHHPVDLFETFADLAMSPEDLAKNFGLTARKTREILALGRMAEPIRQAWRKGEILREVAEAFASIASHEAQAAAFAEIAEEARGDLESLEAYDIRRFLRSDAMKPACPAALYVGADAYIAAGGRIVESLFSEEVEWSDGALLKRLAAEKLTLRAEALAATEGWGIAATDFDALDEQSAPDSDYTEEERERLDAIENEPGDTPDEALARDDERRAIETRAILRAIPAADRNRFAVVVELDFNGEEEITRGLLPLRAAAEARAPVSAHPARDAGGADARDEQNAEASARPEQPADAGLSATCRAVLDDAIATAFAAAIARRPDFAVMLALAALTDRSSPSHGLNQSFCTHPGGRAKNALLEQMDSGLHFGSLETVAAAEHNDVLVAFAHCMGRAVRPAGVGFDRLGALAKTLSAKGCALRADLLAAFDYDGYFAAATKTACEDVILALDAGSRDFLKLKKGELAKATAKLAKDKAWLPEPLASWSARAAGDAQSAAASAQPIAKARSVSRKLKSDSAAAVAADLATLDAAPALAAARADIMTRVLATLQAVHTKATLAEPGARIQPLASFCVRHAQIHDGEDLSAEPLAADAPMIFDALGFELKSWRQKTYICTKASIREAAE